MILEYLLFQIRRRLRPDETPTTSMELRRLSTRIHEETHAVKSLAIDQLRSTSDCLHQLNSHERDKMLALIWPLYCVMRIPLTLEERLDRIMKMLEAIGERMCMPLAYSLVRTLMMIIHNQTTDLECQSARDAPDWIVDVLSGLLVVEMTLTSEPTHGIVTYLGQQVLSPKAV